MIKNYKQFNESLVDDVISDNNDIKILSNKHSAVVYKKDDFIIKRFSKENSNEYFFVKKIFSMNEDIFPKIYKTDDEKLEITIENLNTNKAEKEYNKLKNYCKKQLGVSLYRLLFHEYRDDIIVDLNNIKLIDEYQDIFIKYKILIDNVMKYVGKHYLLDIHSKNFGYNKDGKIKIFDI